MPQTPILWSFRRCPYAMRARLTIAYTGVQTELREILLRDKPDAFLATSPKGTVPVLDTGTDVIAESRDVMLWALAQNDPEGWLDMPAEGHALINESDGPIKSALDHPNYAVRFPDRDASADRAQAATFLHGLNNRLANHTYLLGSTRKMADTATQPFVRQFANTDRAWFDAQDWPHLIRWLTAFETSVAFASVMTKYPPWTPQSGGVPFP
jgi:glutathione S-transferase